MIRSTPAWLLVLSISMAPGCAHPEGARSPDTTARAKADDDLPPMLPGITKEDVVEGTGPAVKKGDRVSVHYTGRLLDGTVFDSSVERGQPISFPLNRVIPGWTEGLQLMKVGDKFKFEIPPNLAYGPSSPSPKIPPNSTLVFEVELLGIE